MLHRIARSAPRALPLLLFVGTVVFAQSVAAQSLLDPLTHPKFVNPVPRPLDPSFIWTPDGQISGEDYYEIGVYQFQQDLGLVDGDGNPLLTTVWGYGKDAAGATYPGRSFEVWENQRIHVRWTNNLVDGTGEPLPHFLPVDATLHWADPLGQGHVHEPYTGPVPIVTHVHGGHSESASDGLPEAWFTPDFGIKGAGWVKETYVYDNDQQAGTIWYHDHALGITRLNVYAGLAGFYIIRDANEASLNLPSGPYEIPLAIQDRMFTEDGQLYYPAMGAMPGMASHMPEFFGDFILVNGKAWPVLDVEPRRYRLRFLNGSDSRFYNMWLTFGPNPDGTIFAGATPTIWQIGTDSGLLDAPVALSKLLLAPGERADCVIDFAGLEGQTLIVKNNAKSPFPKGATVDPATNGQIMAIRVGEASVVDTSSLPSSLRATPIEPLQPTAGVDPRQLLLFEGTDEQGRLQALLGTVAEGAKLWDDPTTEIVGYGDTEIWEIYNTTADAHPMHLHLVSFQILSRQRFRATQDPETAALTAIRLIGKPTAPRPEENGWKDTAQMYPGEVTRVIARFDRSGEYVWHCHILSHEDHEMMRRFEVVEPFARELPDAGGAQASAALPELLPVQPNPFNPRTSVAFALPVAGTAELAVFNVRGERVRTLVREHLPAGSHAYIWNGCDDAGRPVASGIYYARLLSAGVQRAEPMTLAR